MKKELENKSKFLSLVLRHQPEKIGLTLNKEGYANVKELCQKMPISLTDLEEVVSTNDKKRFAFNEDKTLIRASQGHSVDNVSISLKKVEPPIQLFHGTKREYIESIKEKGLIKGSRHHVHLSATKDVAKNVADRRKGESVILEIDVAQLRALGHKFYLSENDVWLSDDIPAKYIIFK